MPDATFKPHERLFLSTDCESGKCGHIVFVIRDGGPGCWVVVSMGWEGMRCGCRYWLREGKGRAEFWVERGRLRQPDVITDLGKLV